MTTAWWGLSMVRAQVTAWSEWRSQGGASVVVITGNSSRRVWLGDLLHYSRPHRQPPLCAAILALSLPVIFKERPSARAAELTYGTFCRKYYPNGGYSGSGWVPIGSRPAEINSTVTPTADT